MATAGFSGLRETKETATLETWCEDGPKTGKTLRDLLVILWVSLHEKPFLCLAHGPAQTG